MTPQFFDAFRLHDQEGFTLDLSYDAAKINGVEVNLAAFACDALGAGWPEEKVEREITKVRPDVVWDDFRFRMASLWTVTGKLADPGCWAAMKQHIVDADKRSAGI